MEKLRPLFWKKVKEMIAWCTNEELRVLRQMAGKEIENRLAEETKKLDADLAKKANAKHAKVKINAMSKRK